MTPPQPFKAKLEDKIVHNDKFTELHFELVEPNNLEFTAGQYVSIKVDEKGTRRSYSICSSPDIKHGFELLLDVSPDGVGTKYLTGLNPGDEIELLAPLGQFVIAPDTEEESIVFVATGSGITPVWSMLLDLLQVKHDQRQIYLHWGVRYVDSLIWLDRIQDLEASFSNFHFHPVVSRPVEEWTLCRGRVTDCLATHELPPSAGYYLCGGKPMIESVVQLLSEKGVGPNHIHHEKFF